jgi:hypothetical protein
MHMVIAEECGNDDGGLLCLRDHRKRDDLIRDRQLKDVLVFIDAMTAGCSCERRARR